MPDSIVGAHDAPTLLAARQDRSVLDAMVAFIQRRLVKDVQVDGQRFLADVKGRMEGSAGRAMRSRSCLACW